MANLDEFGEEGTLIFAGTGRAAAFDRVLYGRSDADDDFQARYS